jgi:hypothetical protein
MLSIDIPSDYEWILNQKSENFYELNCNRNSWKFLELWISLKFRQQAPCYTLLQEKNPFLTKEDQKVEFHSKWEIGLISR